MRTAAPRDEERSGSGALPPTAAAPDRAVELVSGRAGAALPDPRRAARSAVTVAPTADPVPAPARAGTGAGLLAGPEQMVAPPATAPGVAAESRRRAGWWERLALLGVLAVALAYPFAWSNLLPFGRGPDEPDHFDMVDFILAERRLPVFGPEADRWVHRSALGQPVESYAIYPLFTYLLAAPLAAFLPIEPFRAARLVSTLSVLTIVLCTYLSARRLAPGRPGLALLSALVVALIPQLAFVGAYLNRDALGAALAAVVVYLSTRGALDGWTPRLALATGAVVGLVGATNYPAYPVAVVPGLLMLAGSPAGTAGNGRSTSWRTRLGLGVLAGAAALLTGGWWFARNVVLYGELMPEGLLRRSLIAAAPDYPVATADRGHDALSLVTRTPWLYETFKSFWGVFDYQNLFLPAPIYDGLLALCAFAGLGLLGWLAGALWRAGRGGPDRSGAAARRVLLVAVWALLVVLVLSASVWSSVSRDNSPQGRYLFPALVPLGICFATGWLAAASALVRLVAWGGDGRLASAGRASAALALVAGLVWLNLFALTQTVIPRYFTGGADRLRLTVSEPTREATIRRGTPQLAEGWAVVERALPWRPAYLLVPPQWYTPVDALRLYADAAPGAGGIELATARAVPREDVARRFGRDSALALTGWEAAWRPDGLTPGRHRLFVCAWGGLQGERYCTTVPVTVVDP